MPDGGPRNGHAKTRKGEKEKTVREGVRTIGKKVTGRGFFGERKISKAFMVKWNMGKRRHTS